MEISKDFHIKNFQALTFAPFNRPMFYVDEQIGVVRALGYLVVCSPEFVEYNCSPFGTYVVGEDGIIITTKDFNNGDFGVFPGPFEKESWEYKTAYDAFLASFPHAGVEGFLKYCKEIGLEIII